MAAWPLRSNACSRPVVSLLLSAVCVGVLAAPHRAAAGAWEQAEGACYLKVWGTGLFGDQAFPADGGSPEPVESYQNVSLNHYVECGLPHKLTVVTTGRPVGFASYGDDSTAYVGLLSLGLRRSFLEGPFRLSVQLDYGYQGLAGDTDLAAVSGPAGFVYRPVVASHVGKLFGSAGYGTSWGWLAFDAGLGLWSADIPAAFVGMAQVGVTLVDNFTFDLHVPVQIHFEGITEDNLAGSGATNYVGVGIGVSWQFTEAVALTLSFDGAPYAVANSATPSLQAGAEWKID